MKQKFIVTNDAITKDILIEDGLILVSESNNEWVFINDTSVKNKFNKDKKLKFRLTNKLNI